MSVAAENRIDEANHQEAAEVLKKFKEEETKFEEKKAQHEEALKELKEEEEKDAKREEPGASDGDRVWTNPQEDKTKHNGEGSSVYSDAASQQSDAMVIDDRQANKASEEAAASLSLLSQLAAFESPFEIENSKAISLPSSPLSVFSPSSSETYEDEEEPKRKKPPTDNSGKRSRSYHKRRRTEPGNSHSYLIRRKEDEKRLCEKCKRFNYDSDLAYCTNCSNGYHLQCLNPPLKQIPHGDWFCPPCHAALMEIMNPEVSLSLNQSPLNRRARSGAKNTINYDMELSRRETKRRGPGRPKRNQTEDEEDDDSSDGEYDKKFDTIPCEKCGLSTDDDRLMLCDGCDRGFHIYCLDPALPAVPSGSWYCAECAPKRTAPAAAKVDESKCITKTTSPTSTPKQNTRSKGPGRPRKQAQDETPVSEVKETKEKEVKVKEVKNKEVKKEPKETPIPKEYKESRRGIGRPRKHPIVEKIRAPLHYQTHSSYPGMCVLWKGSVKYDEYRVPNLMAICKPEYQKAFYHHEWEGELCGKKITAFPFSRELPLASFVPDDQTSSSFLELASHLESDKSVCYVELRAYELYIVPGIFFPGLNVASGCLVGVVTQRTIKPHDLTKEEEDEEEDEDDLTFPEKTEVRFSFFTPTSSSSSLYSSYQQPQLDQLRNLKLIYVETPKPSAIEMIVIHESLIDRIYEIPFFLDYLNSPTILFVKSKYIDECLKANTMLDPSTVGALLFPKGGIVVVPQEIILNVDRILDNIVTLFKEIDDEEWILKISSKTYDFLSTHSSMRMSSSRIKSSWDTIDNNKSLVQIMMDGEFKIPKTPPIPAGLQTTLGIQLSNASEYRFSVLLTNESTALRTAAQHQIGCYDPATFLQWLKKRKHTQRFVVWPWIKRLQTST